MTKKELIKELTVYDTSVEEIVEYLIKRGIIEMEPEPPEIKPGTVVIRDGIYGIVANNEGIVYFVENEEPNFSVVSSGWEKAFKKEQILVDVPNTPIKRDAEKFVLKWHLIHYGKEYGTLDADVVLSSDDLKRIWGW